MDLDVPKFNCYVPGNYLDDDQARELFKYTLANRQSFSDLAAMDVGVSTMRLRVAGVPTRDDELDACLINFGAEKIEAVNLDVGKIDHVLTGGIIHYHILRFCQNTRPGFLAHNTPTPLFQDHSGFCKLPSNDWEFFQNDWKFFQAFLSPCAPKALVALI